MPRFAVYISTTTAVSSAVSEHVLKQYFNVDQRMFYSFHAESHPARNMREVESGRERKKLLDSERKTLRNVN